MAAQRFELRTLRVWTACSSQLSYAAILYFLELMTGIEPVTLSLPRIRSTDWATPAESVLVAGRGLEPLAFGLWARRATNCSTPRFGKEYGAGERNRTPNLLITSQLLCQLSYTSVSRFCLSAPCWQVIMLS